MSSHTLIIADGALGDMVLLWPALRALAPLTLVGPGGKVELAAAWIEGVTAIDRASGGWERLDSPECRLEETGVAELLASAEQVIHVGTEPSAATLQNLERFAPRARRVFVRSRPPDSQPIHVVEFHRRQLEQTGIVYTPAHPSSRFDRDGPVLIAPGSGGRAKCWPAGQFETLAERLEAAGRRIVFVTGYVEADWVEDAQLRQWRDRFGMIQPPSPCALAEAIVQASAFVGNDSGPTHLAAQLGVPTFALFGPTDPRVWSPLGPAVTVIAPESPAAMTWLDVEAAYAAIARGLGLNP